MSPALHYKFCAQHILIRVRKTGRKEGGKRQEKGKEKRWEEPFDATHGEKTTTHERGQEREKKPKVNSANQIESSTTQRPTRGGKHQWW